MTQSKIENRKSKIRYDLGAILLIVALVLLFFWRIITPRLEDRAAFPPGDFTDQFWMFRVYEARAFTQGRLPLWSENFNSGHPFLADVQSAIFYPVSLIWMLIVVAMRGDALGSFTLFDLELEAIFHFILAGIFTYFFAKRLLGSRIPALISAITFTFSGYLLSYPPLQLAILETATWLPMILLLLDLAIERDVERGQVRTSADNIFTPRPSASVRVLIDYIFAGVVLGIAMLAGHPQTFLFVGYASVIFFAWRITNYQLPITKSLITHYVLRFAFVTLVAALLSAAQWIPSLEYQLVSTRAAIGWEEASRGFPTIDPLQMILPGFTAAFQAPLYIGILPLWLALFALFVNRSREKIFWALLALGSLILSFGAYAFAFAVFYLFVPGFSIFRGQERLALVVAFSSSILAGYGFRDLIQPTLDTLRVRVRRAWALLPAGIVISVMLMFTMYVAGAQRATGRLAFLSDRAAFMVLLFIIATAITAWHISAPRSSQIRIFAVLAIALIAFDLFTINNPAYNASLDPRYPLTDTIETIRNDTNGEFRVADEGKMPGHFGIAYRVQEIGGISPLRIKWYDALLDGLPAEKLYPLLNVRYLITERPGFANADIVAQEGKTRALELQNTMPRAWFVGNAQVADDATTLAAMQSDSFNPRAIAYLAELSPIVPVPNAALIVPTFEHRDAEHESISIQTPTDGLLIISEPYYPGWQATVDGVSTPILRANLALRAIPIRAGTHRIELIFDPWSVKIGIALTLVTTIVILILLAFYALRFTR